MNRKIVALSLIFAGLGLIAAIFFIRFIRARRPTAGLKVETTPQSTVFVDNVQIGTTPLEKLFPPGEVTVKLIPNSTSSAISNYETKVRLTQQVYTVIKREFASNDNQSSGDVVTLEAQSGKGASLNIITSAPDSAAVVLDGQPQGFTPLSLPTVNPGDHQLVISSPGYLPRSIVAQAVAGYRLTVTVKLASSLVETLLPTPVPSPISSPSATPSTRITPTLTLAKPSSTPVPATPTPSIPKPYVRVLDTPVGFLRVRSGPGTNFSEVGQVKPGSNYPLLTSQTDWYQISVPLSATTSGWISSQYAQKFE